MKGYPKNLNTKEDYLYAAQNFPKEMWGKDFQNLLSSESDWMYAGELPNKAAGVEDIYHRIEENTDPQTGAISYTQYEWKSNPDAKIYRLGFTIAEVQNIIDNGGVAA